MATLDELSMAYRAKQQKLADQANAEKAKKAAEKMAERKAKKDLAISFLGNDAPDHVDIMICAGSDTLVDGSADAKVFGSGNLGYWMQEKFVIAGDVYKMQVIITRQ